MENKFMRTHRQLHYPWQLILWLAFLPLLFLLAACQQQATASDLPSMPGGDAQRGARLIETYGCGTCHTIPGIQEANAMVGPPLNAWAERQYIAGAIPNTPENLVFWIMNPQDVEPGTIMPDMGVSEPDARDIGAYLYTLRR